MFSFTHRWLEWLGKGLQIPIMQVRFLSDAPYLFYATLAQMVEQLTCNEQVVSSILTSGSIFYAGVAQLDRATAF
tara:strand:- start:58 stop:282 length:225 start_codon:yes stop_codon:yes gene_type:complete